MPIAAGSAITLSQLSTVAPYVRYLEIRGYEVQPALANFGLSPELLINDEVFVHSDIIYALVSDFASLSGDAHFGIHVGESFDFETWPPFHDAVSNSDQLGEFLTRLIEAVPKASSAVRYKLFVQAEVTELFVERQYQPEISTVHIDAFGVAFFTRLFESVVGKSWDPDKVTVRALDITVFPNHYKGMKLKFSDTSGVWINFPTRWLYRKIELNSA